MAIVYQHRRNDTNEVFYVGIGKEEKRAYAKSKADRVNPHWFRIVKKVGYTVEITHRDVIWEEACSIERYLIAFYGRRDQGPGTLVNLTDGGDGVIGRKHSEETIALLTVQNNTPERKAISANNLKLSRTPENILKARNSRDYKRIGDLQKIPVLQYSLEGKFIREWKSAKDVARELNLNYQSVNQNVRGKSKSAGDFIWKYKGEIIQDVIAPYFTENQSDDYKNRVKEWMSIPITQYDLKGNFIQDWKSASDAARYYDFKSCNITACCKDRTMTSNGFIWKYSNNN